MWGIGVFFVSFIDSVCKMCTFHAFFLAFDNLSFSVCRFCTHAHMSDQKNAARSTPFNYFLSHKKCAAIKCYNNKNRMCIFLFELMAFLSSLQRDEWKETKKRNKLKEWAELKCDFENCIHTVATQNFKECLSHSFSLSLRVWLTAFFVDALVSQTETSSTHFVRIHTKYTIIHMHSTESEKNSEIKEEETEWERYEVFITFSHFSL